MSINPTDIASARRASNGFVPLFSNASQDKSTAIGCHLCSNFMYSSYFLVNKHKVCAACAENARNGQLASMQSSAAGAFVFGGVGAIFGMVLYSAITLSTGWSIGYLACLLGVFVGFAVKAGAEGATSASVRIVAALLAYVAISLDTIPGLIFTTYTHSAGVDWVSFFSDNVYNGLISPFHGFGTNSAEAMINLLVLAIGMRVATYINRVKPNVVAGPFALKAAA